MFIVAIISLTYDFDSPVIPLPKCKLLSINY